MVITIMTNPEGPVKCDSAWDRVRFDSYPVDL